ncbi:tetratricopeptide repeat protein [Shewanella sp. NFH-SH190041]|uniref:tetratricopeptide repeat protein n=1 Tax=Shewanella sp. NFH-SH190041 TaxID=2950245 RepID=UPI0021C463DC|nr:tetratricopeptide repeat protein [Shewanella sp. NFH-SH190041]
MNCLQNVRDLTLLSAVVKDTPISGAKVTLQRSGSSSVMTTTNTNGIANPTGLPDDNKTTMLIEKAGYSTLVAQCPCNGFTYAMSPKMTNLDGLRIVLTWDDSVPDLDSHLVYPHNHIYFASKHGSQALLDVDDTDYFGPETVTIEKKKQGQRYVYAVNDYTHLYDSNSWALSNSHARVDVYVGESLIRTYKVSPNIQANKWVVFGIDENGTFQDINQYASFAGEPEKYLQKLIQAPSFESHSIITESMKNNAKDWNRQGESDYKNKNYNAALYAFQQAVNLDPNNGQVYSNLGVTYSKMGRRAEALWANRKAIELAHGRRAHIIKASSYYNIGRIYESEGAWQEALSNYRAALSYREHSAYTNGIARMEKHLNQ